MAPWGFDIRLGAQNGGARLALREGCFTFVGDGRNPRRELFCRAAHFVPLMALNFARVRYKMLRDMHGQDFS